MYIGIDVDKRFLTIKEVNEKGEPIGESKIRNCFQAMDKFGRGHDKTCKIAIEASSYSMHVYRYLVKLGFEVHMAHPGALDKITKSNSKTDEHDALDLAQLLRTGYLPEAWIGDEEVQSIRSLIGRRVDLGRSSTKAKNRIHGLLAINGVEEPLCSDLFGRMGMHFLEGLNLQDEFNVVLKSLLRELAYINEELGFIESEIARVSMDGRFGEEIERLMEIKGIDFYSALAIMAWIVDINRFSSDRKLSSWVGLVPRVRQSGNREIHGHITKAGSEIVRWLLISGSTVTVKYPGKLRRYYLRLKKRVGHGKAIVATAHKLIKIIFHMLKENKHYEERDDDLVYRKLKRMERKARKNIEESDKFKVLEKRGREMFMKEVAYNDVG